MGRSRTLRARRAASSLLAAVVALATATVPGHEASADVVAVTGSAYGFWTNVSLFGGPSSTHGPTPAVTLPANGSATPIVQRAPEGGKGQYGPAVVFGGIWPDTAPTGPPSGPISVSTQGALGPTGAVTSSVDIVLYNPPRPDAPGGIGPGPLIADEAHSSCTATESGVTGASHFVNGKVETKYDVQSQLAIPEYVKPIPADPPVNQEYTGTIDHVGDHFRILINEQIRSPNGTLTVNAAHMFLLGPIAVGEMIVGQSVCGVTGGAALPPVTQPAPGGGSGPSPPPAPSATPATEAPGAAPGTTALVATSTSTSTAPSTTVPLSFDSRTGSPGGALPPLVGDTGTPTTRRSDQSALRVSSASEKGGGFPLVLLLVAVGVGVATAVILTRRRRAA